MGYSATEIRNIALIGHGSSGKTTLADAILATAGKVERIGSSADGTLSLDYDPEERRRGASVGTACWSFEYGGGRINLLDTPGLFDFAGGVSEGLTAADLALTVLSGKSGLSTGAKINFDLAGREGVPRAFFIGKLDSPHSYFYRVLSTLTASYGGVICPVTVPYAEGETVRCFVDLIRNKAFSYDGLTASEVPVPASEDIANVRAVLLENIASVDEELMEKYFAGEEFTEEEMTAALRRGMVSGEVVPVFAGINQTGAGVPLMLDILTEIAPTAAERVYTLEDDSGEKKITPGEGPATAVVWATRADAFQGKLSYLKVITGRVSAGDTLHNSRTGEAEKIGKITRLLGAKQEDAGALEAGDIGAVAKLSSVLTGDTLTAGSGFIHCVEFPEPTTSVAVYARNKGDDEKISAGLSRLMEEDPTISYATNSETGEQILKGLGEQHLDVVASKLRSKFGVEVEFRPAKVPYRETIRGTVKVQGRHKKQSGGHGQYGDVWIEFSPVEGDGIVFEEKIFGGAVPKNYFPAVEKGIRESATKGVLAGYPMVGVKATLVDGSYHPVDSSEIAFKTAASIAYREGIPKAKPVLLEPIGTLRANIPDDIMGDVLGDINRRRGRVLGMNPLADKRQEVVAEVPSAEMSDFPVALRSLSGGRASFTFVFERYEEAPPPVAEKVIAEAEK